jgi:hypothetical protein
MSRWIAGWTREIRRQGAGLRAVATEHLAVGGGIAAWAGPGAWANQAVGVGLAGPVTDVELDALVAFYADHGAPARIEVPPFAHPTLVDGLAARGFVLERFEDAWLRALPAGEDLAAALPHGWPAGVTTEVVPPDAPDEAIDAFVAVSSSGFVPEGGALSEADRAVARRMARDPRVLNVLVRVDGVPAGAGSASAGEGAAGLFGASTLAPFRRRGVQLAGIVARLVAVRDAGATVACIESLPGAATARNAARLGFTLAGTKVVLRGPPPAG